MTPDGGLPQRARARLREPPSDGLSDADGAPGRLRKRRRGPARDVEPPTSAGEERPRMVTRSLSKCSDHHQIPSGGGAGSRQVTTASLCSSCDHQGTPSGDKPQRPRRIARAVSDFSGRRDTPDGYLSPARSRRKTRGSRTDSGRTPQWADLPDPLLYSIFQRLSVVEFAALAGTCKAWRTFAAAAREDLMASQPPLLCSTDGTGIYDPVRKRILKHRRLLFLVRRRNAKILGICHGYLVMKCSSGTQRQKQLVLLNLLTGDEVVDTPFLPRGNVAWVVLTAPPASPVCVVIACLKRRADFQHGAVLSCRRGDSQWSMWEFYGSGKPVVLQQRLFAVEWMRSGIRLLVSGPYRFPARDSEVLNESPDMYCKHLVVVDGKLIFIEHWGEKVVANQLLGDRGEKMEKMTDLGDRALVVNQGGFAVSERPSRWGGEANSIYFTCGSRDLRIQGVRLEDGQTMEAPLNAAYPLKEDDPLKTQMGGPHPRVLWLLPSLCWH